MEGNINPLCEDYISDHIMAVFLSEMICQLALNLSIYQTRAFVLFSMVFHRFALSISMHSTRIRIIIINK